MKIKGFGITILLMVLGTSTGTLAKKTMGETTSIKPKTGGSIFISTAIGDVDTVRAIVAKRKSVIKDRNSDGWTALHLAAAFGRSEILHFLLDQGADVLKTGHDGALPFHLAAFFHHQECAKILLKKTVDEMTKKGEIRLGEDGNDPLFHRTLCRWTAYGSDNPIAEFDMHLASRLTEEQKDLVADAERVYVISEYKLKPCNIRTDKDRKTTIREIYPKAPPNAKLWEEWHESTIVAQGVYQEGNSGRITKLGPWRYWDDSGRMIEEAFFVKGFSHGSWKSWHSSGKEKCRVQWSGGHLVSWQCRDERGQIVPGDRFNAPFDYKYFKSEIPRDISSQQCK